MQEEREQLTGSESIKTPSKRYLRISRKDTLVNDLKNSTQSGILSFIFSIIALGFFIAGLIRSYNFHGEAGRSLWLFTALSFFFMILSVLFSIIGFKNRAKVRHYMERRGLFLSIIVFGLLLWIFIKGITA